MIKRILRRSAREPITCIAAILFAAILTVILCYLHQSQKAEQQNYENTFHSIPVEFEITKLNGNRLDESAHIDGYMADLFFENSVFEPNFPWRKKWQPTPLFLSGESHGRRSLAGYSPWHYKESDTTE